MRPVGRCRPPRGPDAVLAGTQDDTTDDLAVEALRVERPFAGDHEVGPRQGGVQPDVVGHQVQTGSSQSRCRWALNPPDSSSDLVM